MRSLLGNEKSVIENSSASGAEGAGFVVEKVTHREARRQFAIEGEPQL
jgi:hypothetical protein